MSTRRIVLPLILSVAAISSGRAEAAHRAKERGPAILDKITFEKARTPRELDRLIGPARPTRGGRDVVLVPGFTRNYANSLRPVAEHLASHPANGGAVAVYLPSAKGFFRNGDFSRRGRLKIDDLMTIRVWTLEQNPLAKPSENRHALAEMNYLMAEVHGERQARGLVPADRAFQPIIAAHSAGNSVVDEAAAHGNIGTIGAKPDWVAIANVFPTGTIMGTLGKHTLAKIFSSAPRSTRGPVGKVRYWGHLAGEAASELAIDSPQIKHNRGTWDTVQRGAFGTISQVFVAGRASPTNTWAKVRGKVRHSSGPSDGFAVASATELPGASPMTIVPDDGRSPLVHIDGPRKPAAIKAIEAAVTEAP